VIPGKVLGLPMDWRESIRELKKNRKVGAFPSDN
jgi:hypothetical protein